MNKSKPKRKKTKTKTKNKQTISSKQPKKILKNKVNK